ncbi:hypothetical protein HanIR_Chr16g0825301 [Helianthus annuus]|nr:hypothetical protein HanIR_Chr16g0825301 [Helianthus annuus]
MRTPKCPYLSGRSIERFVRSAGLVDRLGIFEAGPNRMSLDRTDCSIGWHSLLRTSCEND